MLIFVYRTAAPIDPELKGIIEKAGAIPGLDYVVERAVRAEDNPLEDEGQYSTQYTMYLLV